MKTTGEKVCIIHWNEPDKLKLFDTNVVCLTANNKIMTLKVRHEERDWKWLCEKYHIKYWCFLSELIPD